MNRVCICWFWQWLTRGWSLLATLAVDGFAAVRVWLAPFIKYEIVEGVLIIDDDDDDKDDKEGVNEVGDGDSDEVAAAWPCSWRYCCRCCCCVIFDVLCLRTMVVVARFTWVTIDGNDRIVDDDSDPITVVGWRLSLFVGWFEPIANSRIKITRCLRSLTCKGIHIYNTSISRGV